VQILQSRENSMSPATSSRCSHALRPECRKHGQAGQWSVPDSRTYRISVDVNLVVLHPTVRDGKGRFAPDLRVQDFEIYEDGVRQTIQLFRHEDVPVTVGLIVDHSSSMRHKFAEVSAAARTFVHSSRPDDQMFVVNFNEKVTLGLPDAVGFTDSSEELERAIFRTPADGMTALYDAVAEGQARLQAGSRDKKVLIVISDGEDNASKSALADALKIAERSSALVYTIGIFDPDDEDKNPDVLRRLARTTGGDAFFPERLTDVVAICERIAGDIRHQYTLGYVSSNGEPWCVPVRSRGRAGPRQSQTRGAHPLRLHCRQGGEVKLIVARKPLRRLLR
jgi:Ca-activated chloride channel family protein